MHKVLLCSPRVYFPVLCTFWYLYGGVNGDLLQEGLFHTQVGCTQSPSLRQTTADPDLRRRRSNTVLSQPLCEQALFEPSEHLWWRPRWLSLLSSSKGPSLAEVHRLLVAAASFMQLRLEARRLNSYSALAQSP